MWMLDLASRRQAAGKLFTACKFNRTWCIKHQREYTCVPQALYRMIYNVVFFEVWLHRAAEGMKRR